MSPLVKQRLLANWGDKATAMACYAEARVWEEPSGWSMYLLAMNPDAPDEVYAIIDGQNVEVGAFTFSEILNSCNAHGTFPCIDPDYRRRWASELFKQLNEERP